MNAKRIAIIDDEQDIREFLTYNLTKAGYKVESYGEPLNGVWKILDNPPDLVLTDWLMPEIDGLDVCKVLKTYFKEKPIPIIMITCKSGISEEFKALEAGVDEYLTKPFQIKDLLIIIKKHLLN